MVTLDGIDMRWKPGMLGQETLPEVLGIPSGSNLFCQEDSYKQEHDNEVVYEGMVVYEVVYEGGDRGGA